MFLLKVLGEGFLYKKEGWGVFVVLYGGLKSRFGILYGV